MKIEIEVSDEIISNLLCSAFEGGSNYWIASTKTVEAPSGHFDRTTTPLEPGGKVIVTLDEEHTKGAGVTYVLDRDAIARGLVALQREVPHQFGNALGGNDDASTGDCFLQCCLFGEIVFA